MQYRNAHFRKYPFDEQRMDVILENINITSDKLRIVSDSTSYEKSGQEPTMQTISNDLLREAKSSSSHIFKTEISEGIGIYNSNFGDESLPNQTKYGRLTISVFFNRSFLPYISKFLIPLMIILLLVYFVFFLPADKIEIAAALTVTSLLSAIAFQTTINSDLPDIGYITYVDKVFHTCYLLIALSMAQSLGSFYLESTGDPSRLKLSKRLILLSRLLYPVIFFVALYISR